MPAQHPHRRQRHAARLHRRRPLRHRRRRRRCPSGRSGCSTAMGYTVAHNKPYAGGFITEHYGRPARDLHALQIEVNRGLYMDETTLAEIGRLRCACRRSGAVFRRSDGGSRPSLRRPAAGGGIEAPAAKKDRPGERSKSREETPKEGMDRKTCPNSNLLCTAQKSRRFGLLDRLQVDDGYCRRWAHDRDHCPTPQFAWRVL